MAEIDWDRAEAEICEAEKWANKVLDYRKAVKDVVGVGVVTTEEAIKALESGEASSEQRCLGFAEGCYAAYTTPRVVLRMIATIRALQEKNEGLSNFRDQIIRHYENQDMSHLDFRVHAYKHALTLKETPNAD